MLQSDSIVSEGNVAESQQHSTGYQAKGHQPTPREVISWLPKDATPEQQDSAIQKNIKPSPIHWSNRPDTLHLPGQPIGKSYRDVTLPQYYKESFFQKSKFFHPELEGGRLGVAGDPVPYTIAGDNLITSILLGCFILATLVFSRSRRFIEKQAKNFFYIPRSDNSTMTETSGEVRFQIFLILQTCLLASIVFFCYTRTFVGDTFTIDQYQIIGIYTGIFAGYFLVKTIAYAFVDWVFFDKKKNRQWIQSFLFLISAEGVALFPLVMLLAYFNLSMESAVIYSIIVVILSKLLSFYKSYIIFFRRSGDFLQIILYFCALEIIPLFSLWGLLVLTNSYLKINF
jgi:hypothetical protein